LNELLDDIADFPLEVNKKTPAENLLLWKERFIDEIKRKKTSEKTIRTYSIAIDTFISFSEKHNDKSISLIGAKYINRYLAEYQLKLLQKKTFSWPLKDENIVTVKTELASNELGKNGANFTVFEGFENTLSQRQTIVKIFLKFITENNKDQHDYTSMFKGMAKIKISEKFTDFLTKEEIDRVVSLMQSWPENYMNYKKMNNERYVYRNAALIIIYALTGGRSEEMVHVRLKDIKEDSENNRYIIKINKGKGGKKRSVWIEKFYFEKFYIFFKGILPSDEYYISSTYSNGGYTNVPMSPGHIRTFGNDILNILGIQKTGLHAFRRGYVTNRIIHGKVDISIVAKEAGNTVAILEKHYLKHNATTI